MKIDLSDFLDSGNQVTSYTFDISKDQLPEEDLSSIVDTIHVEVNFYKVHGEIIMDINGSYVYQAPCDRCLTVSTSNIEFKGSGKLVKEEAGNNVEDEESYEIIYYRDVSVDLTDYIWSQITSSLPMKFLCSEDCKGLCQKCGKNLNEGTCDCTIETGDLRFEKLRELSLND
ncbi:MAG: YceD family protein [Bacillota bacterium]